MQKKWKIILGSVAILIIAVVAISQATQGITADVIEVNRGDMAVTFSEDGTVTSPEERTIHPLTTARITEITVEEGDRVRKGDLLLALEDEEMKYQLEEIRARLRGLEGEEQKLYQEPGDAEIKSKQIAIEQAEENKEQLKRDYERIKKLREAGIVSRADLETAEDLLNEARRHVSQQEEALKALKQAYDPTQGSEEIIQAQKDALLSQVSLLEHQMDHYQVHAPVAGKVINLQANEGELASPEAPVMEVFAPDSYEIETDVLARDTYDISEGMPVNLTLERRDTDLEFTGEIIDIAPYAAKDLSPLGLEEERVEVTIWPDLPENVQIAPGFRIEVDFISEEVTDQLIVPERALFTDDGEDALFIVENGRARVQQVTTGLEADNQVAILEGLSAGDLVIVDHQLDNINEGSRIEIPAGDELTEAGGSTAEAARDTDSTDSSSGEDASSANSSQKENDKTTGESKADSPEAEDIKQNNIIQNSNHNVLNDLRTNIHRLGSNRKSDKEESARAASKNDATTDSDGNEDKDKEKEEENGNADTNETTADNHDRQKLQALNEQLYFPTMAHIGKLLEQIVPASSGETINIALDEVGSIAVEQSRSAQRHKWTLQRLKLQKDRIEEKKDDIDEEWDDLREEIDDLTGRIRDMEDRKEELTEFIDELDGGNHHNDNENDNGNEEEKEEQDEEDGKKGEGEEEEQDKEEKDDEADDEDNANGKNNIDHNKRGTMNIEALLREMFSGQVDELENNIKDLRDTRDEMEEDAAEKLDDAYQESEKELQTIEQEIELVNKRWEQQKEQIKYNAENLYMEILSLEKQKEAISENLDLMQELLQQEKTRMEIGQGTFLGVNEVKLNKKELEDNYHTLQSTHQELLLSLSDITGYPSNTDLQLDDISIDIDDIKNKTDFEQILNDALENGLLMEYHRKQVDHAEKNRDYWDENDESIRHDIASLKLNEAELEQTEARRRTEERIHELQNTYARVLRKYAISQRTQLKKEQELENIELKNELGKATALEVSEKVAKSNKAAKQLLQTEYEAYLLGRELELFEQGVLLER